MLTFNHYQLLIRKYVKNKLKLIKHFLDLETFTGMIVYSLHVVNFSIIF